ncbi:MAG: superoxide dismutase [Chitinophagales bacterium]
MNKRQFIKAGTVLTVGALVTPLASCGGGQTETKQKPKTRVKEAAKAFDPFTLPELPYAQNALEPYIDAQTMGIHHGKHHAGYVRKLNAALKGHALAGKDLKSIVQAVTDKDTGVRNNGGGHFNHSLFWNVMQGAKENNTPTGKLGEAINSTFANFDEFKTQFSKAASTRFGSGWAWLSVDDAGKLFVSSTPNQDNPLMKNLVEQSGTPILGIDVWEHAYYLKYQNLRGDYIGNFFNLVNWEAVAANYETV